VRLSGEFEKRLTALEDAEKIKKLHQKYMDLMDYLDYEGVMDLFTEDATAEVRNSGVKKGKKAISEIYLGKLAKERLKRTELHMAVQPDITVDGNNAKGTWLIYMLFCVPTPNWVQGKNECEYRKENGEWKISKLKFTRTMSTNPSLYP
jgi:ketosteroid isomerase-like protein